LPQYGGDVVDTLRGTFTRDARVPGHSVSTTLKFSDEELALLREQLHAIDFWNVTKFPAEFTVPFRQGAMTMTDPHEVFSFEVTENGITRKLHWVDNINVKDTTFKPAVELRVMFHKIRDIVESKPEYKKLPPRTFFPR
jgi:hypothetical protein